MAQRDPYGYSHRRIRKALLPYAIGKPCPMCGQVMLATDDLDLDHSVPLAINPNATGDRICHATCNRSAGGKMRARPRSPKPAPLTSRHW